MLSKILRVLLVLIAVASVVIAAGLCLMGVLFSMTDNFNGPHTRTIAGIVLTEICTLIILWRVYRLTK